MRQSRFRDRVPFHQTHIFVNGRWLTNEVADLLEHRRQIRRRLIRKLSSRVPMLMAVLLSMGALVAINALFAGTVPNQDKLVSAPLP